MHIIWTLAMRVPTRGPPHWPYESGAFSSSARMSNAHTSGPHRETRLFKSRLWPLQLLCIITCVYIYIYIYICIYIERERERDIICVCMYVCMYIYIYIYIYTHQLRQGLVLRPTRSMGRSFMWGFDYSFANYRFRKSLDFWTIYCQRAEIKIIVEVQGLFWNYSWWKCSQIPV